VEKLAKEEKGTNKLNLIMNQINRIYAERGQQPIYYYELITDPDDFMNTVDNAFQLSFLVRDGNIGLSLDEENCPIVRPITKSEQSQKATDSSTVQAIVSLDPKLWRDSIEMYNVQEPLLIVNREEPASQQVSQSQRRDGSQMNGDDD
jgi:non-structural maintenance of chromosomes element 4